MKINSFTATNAPLTCIVHFSNPVGIKLAKMLLEQGSKVVLIDSFSTEKKHIISDLVKHEDCIFMDIETTFTNLEKFKKIDYIYYFENHVIQGITYRAPQKGTSEIKALQHQSFTSETNRLDAYIKLAIEYKAKFLLVTSGIINQLTSLVPDQSIQLQKYAESLFLEYFGKSKFNGRIVRMAEVYGENMDLNLPTPLNRMIREVLYTDVVSIYGEGLQNNYYVSVTDAVYGLLKVNFLERSKGKTYFLAEPHPVSTLNLAYKLLEITSSEKEVLFKDAEPVQQVEMSSFPHVLPAQESGWEPLLHFSKELQNIMPWAAESLKSTWNQPDESIQEDTENVTLRVHTKDEETDDTINKGVDKSSVQVDLFRTLIRNPIVGFFSLFRQRKGQINEEVKAQRKTNAVPWLKITIISIFTISFVLIFTPYILFGVSAYRLHTQVNEARNALLTRNTEVFKRQSKEMQMTVQTLKTTLGWVAYVQYFSEPGQKIYDQAYVIIEGLEYYVMSFEQASTAIGPFFTYINEFKLGEINEPAGKAPREYVVELSNISEQKEEIALASQYAILGEKRLNAVVTGIFPDQIDVLLHKAIRDAQLYTKAVTSLSEIYPYIPYLAGQGDRTNYLLMVQNESEIRSTGGWFSNYAIVGIQNGRVRQLSVDDVYNIDGQTKAKTAPQEMRDGLGINSYTFSLSNWSPDLEKSAAEAESFLKSANKVSDIDITVTFNFAVIQKLLEVTGPVTVGGTGQITSENLFSKIVELHSTFTPGSQQKVAIVSKLVPVLLAKVSDGTIDEKQKLLEVLSEAVVERNIMITSKNESFNDTLKTKYNAVITLNPQDSFAYVVDWNWSGNKTNEFVAREMSVLFDQRVKEATLITKYKNASTQDIYPQGIYKNFQRIYTPAIWTLSSATGYSGNPKVYSEGEQKYTGQMLEIGLSSSKEYELTYSYLSLGPKVFLPKQSGVKSELVTVSFVLAGSETELEDILKAQGFMLKDGKLSKTFVRSGDIEIRLTK